MDSGSVMDYSCDVSMDYFINVAGGRSVLGHNYGYRMPHQDNSSLLL